MSSKRKDYDSTTSQVSSALDYIRGFYPVLIAFVIIVVAAGLYMMNRDLSEAEIFLSQSVDNYYNTTAKVSRGDEKAVLEHLNNIKKGLPSYMKQYVVKDADAIATVITVKYTVDSKELSNLYYIDSQEYKALKEELQSKGYDIE